MRMTEQRTVMLTSTTQRSPNEKPSTFFPISTIVPIASCPGMSCDHGEMHKTLWHWVGHKEGKELTGNFEMNSPCIIQILC